MLAGWLEKTCATISTAWSIVFLILSVFFLVVMVYHTWGMPSPASDHPTPGVTARTILRDFAMTFVTFFKKPHIWSALAFMLLYRLPEAMCVKLVVPFLKAPHAEGGLGLSTAQVGFANGTVGVVALLVGVYWVV